MINCSSGIFKKNLKSKTDGFYVFFMNLSKRARNIFKMAVWLLNLFLINEVYKFLCDLCLDFFLGFLFG